MVVYLDTSTLVKLYAEEEGRETVREAMNEADRVVTSVVAYAETRAALARKRWEGAFTEEQYRTAVSDLDRDWEGFRTSLSRIPSPASPETWPNATHPGASTPSISRARNASKKGSTTSVSRLR